VRKQLAVFIMEPLQSMREVQLQCLCKTNALQSQWQRLLAVLLQSAKEQTHDLINQTTKLQAERQVTYPAESRNMLPSSAVCSCCTNPITEGIII